MRAVTILCCVLVVLGASATSARADTAPFADTGLPWADPGHRSPLEVLASSIASTIANRPVSVRCQGENDWQVLAAQKGFDPTRVLGYVTASWYANGVLHSVSEHAELSPRTCLTLQQFAVAAPTKPTKCSTVTSVTVAKSKVVTERVRVRVAAWRLVKGKRVRTTVSTWRTVRKVVPVQETTTVPGQPAPCFLDGVRSHPEDTVYWDQYGSYSRAILTLTHEAVHLGGFVGGTLRNGLVAGYPDSEARADCYGMQWLAYAAERLGAAPDDAHSIARFYATEIYPQRQQNQPEYWSPECRDGGALDLHPETTLWP